MRKVDLSEITYEIKNDRKIYLWNQSIGKKIPFEYDDKIGVLEILSCGKGCITVLYNGETFEIFTKFIKQNKIAKIFEREIIWKYNVGDIISDKVNSHTRHITITNKNYVKNVKNRKHKFYQYSCNICGYDCAIDNHWINEVELDHGKGCSCCAGIKVIQGINDIATTAPWMVKYFVNENDVYTHTRNSNVLLQMKCPNCGELKKSAPYQVVKQGFSCTYCSDGISYSEKFMMNVFTQLGIEYTYQLSKNHFSWIGQYKYDFYIKQHNCIIETHGSQHYKTGFRTELNYIKENDREKYQLALSNHIDKYIVLDCSKSEQNWIVNSILSSDLSKLYDFSNVDFNEADKFANKSIISEICKYYVENYPNVTTKMIAEQFKVSRTAVTRYLNIGTRLRLCNYESVQSGAKERANKYSKPIKVIDGKDIYYFKSIKLMKKLYKSIFGKNVTDKCVYAALKNQRETYDNRQFVYCSKEEFNQIHIVQNDKVYGDPFILSIL